MKALANLDALNRASLARGWPALSAWWLATLQRFVTSRRRQLVARVGRRGGKSSSLCRFAVAFALGYNEKLIPPGDLGVVAFISVSRDEASQRLRTIKGLLDVIGVKWRAIEGGVELVGRRIAFKVYAATVAGVSGFTAALIIADELAKWRDADTNANPALAVLASVRPTMATQPDARIILSSSAFGTIDAHAQAFDQGETDFQCVAYAPTWIANPTITEDESHQLEPDPRVWRREYLAEPQAGALGAFDPEHVDAAMRERVVPPSVQEGIPLVMIDASSGHKDSWTWAPARWLIPPSTQVRMVRRYVPGSATHGRPRYVWEPARDETGQRVPLSDDERFAPVLRVEEIRSVDGVFWKNVSAAEIVERVTLDVRTLHATHVVGDQREAYALSSLFAQKSVAFTHFDWTNKPKAEAVATVRRWLRDDQLWLPKDAKLRRELVQYEETITPSGNLKYGARGNNHDDRTALLLTLAMSENAGLLSMSPLARGRPRDLTNLPSA